MGLGPVVLGYCNDSVDRAVAEQLRRGTHFSLVSPSEVEYAGLLASVIPCAEKVRFFKTGSSACEAAIRVARAFTGRRDVIRGEYHGWHEWTAARNGFREAGVLPEVRQYTHRCAYNDLAAFERLFERHPGDIAAVIIEPAILEEPRDGFLSRLRELVRAQGALLIFDEVVTGFRFDLGGAQKLFGVTPDLAAFGKAAANGLPLSFLAGRREILDSVAKDVFLFTTFGGERLSLAAGIAVFQEMRDRPVIPRLWEIGARLKRETNGMAERLGVGIRLEGFPVRLMFRFSGMPQRRLFMHECIRRGVFIGWTVFPCFTHTDSDIDRALEVFGEAMQAVKDQEMDLRAWGFPDQGFSGKGTAT